MTQQEELDRMRLERDIATKTAGDLMEENRKLKNQPELLAAQEAKIQELRLVLRDVTEVLVRPLVGKKNTPRKFASCIVDLGRIANANREVLDRADSQIRMLLGGAN